MKHCVPCDVHKVEIARLKRQLCDLEELRQDEVAYWKAKAGRLQVKVNQWEAWWSPSMPPARLR